MTTVAAPKSDASRSNEQAERLPPRGRAGNGVHCLVCSATLNPNRASRRQRYCSSACRQQAFRAKKWARRYKGPDPLRSARNNTVASTACRAGFGDLTPVKILGRAFRWPGAARPEITTLIHSIITSEIGAPDISARRAGR
jgi:hypothetical protein